MRLVRLERAEDTGARDKRNPKDRKSPPGGLVYRLTTPNGTPLFAGFFESPAAAAVFCKTRSWRMEVA